MFSSIKQHSYYSSESLRESVCHGILLKEDIVRYFFDRKVYHVVARWDRARSQILFLDLVIATGTCRLTRLKTLHNNRNDDLKDVHIC